MRSTASMKNLMTIFGVLSITITMFSSCGCEGCGSFRDDFKCNDFQGVITTKYDDQNNHGAPTVRFENGGSMVFLGYGYMLYDAISVGDSLSKMSGSDSMQVFRGDSAFKLWVVCPE